MDLERSGYPAFLSPQLPLNGNKPVARMSRTNVFWLISVQRNRSHLLSRAELIEGAV